MDFLKLLGGAVNVIGQITGIDALKDVGNKIEKDELPPEQKAQLQNALMQHEQEMKKLSIEEAKLVVSESLAMIASPDKYVARARPTGLYIAYGITALLALVQAFLILYAAFMGQQELKLDLDAILALIVPLYGYAGYYAHNRTKEKLQNGK